MSACVCHKLTMDNYVTRGHHIYTQRNVTWGAEGVEGHKNSSMLPTEMRSTVSIATASVAMGYVWTMVWRHRWDVQQTVVLPRRLGWILKPSSDCYKTSASLQCWSFYSPRCAHNTEIHREEKWRVLLNWEALFAAVRQATEGFPSIWHLGFYI